MNNEDKQRDDYGLPINMRGCVTGRTSSAEPNESNTPKSGYWPVQSENGDVDRGFIDGVRVTKGEAGYKPTDNSDLIALLKLATKVTKEGQPVKYDGCSGGMSAFWRAVFKRPPPWEGCCDEHDQPYAAGGTRRDRLTADDKLRACVEAKGHPIWAFLMFWGVRFGGHPLWPFPWRWGFSKKWYTPYEYPDYKD